MKTKILLTLAFILMITWQGIAQPLPPIGPNGNPVPVGALGMGALVVGGLLLFLIGKKNKNEQ